MKILLVSPSPLKHRLFLNLNKFSPFISFTLKQLAAITPAEHEVEVFDGNTYEIMDVNKKFDLVGLSCLTPHAPRAYEIADFFRSKGVTVVLGGYHPSALPEEAKQHADSVVIGEAEINWPKLLKDFENGKMKSFYKQEKPVNPCLIPPARRFPLKGFYPVFEMQITRGCPYRCEFCSIQNVEGHKFRKRPIENVIEEIKNTKAINLFFNDASVTTDPEYIKTIFREMKGLGKRFGCNGNISALNDDEEMIKLSKEAGCLMWYIGLESVSQDSLDSIKKANKVKNYAQAIKKIRKHGVAIQGMFVFGFDTDKLTIFSKTLKAIKNWKIDVAHFSILTPFPGTPVYERLEQDGRILTKDWAKYTFGNVVFEPKNMTKKELFSNTRKVAKSFYSLSNIMRRNLDVHHLDLVQLKYKVQHNLEVRNFLKKEFSF